MHILSAAQTQEIDQQTIKVEGISSLMLMERAGRRLYERIIADPTLPSASHYVVLCGSGNNGGDGLVIARLLAEADQKVSVIHAQIGRPTAENEANRKALPNLQYQDLAQGDPLPVTQAEVLIDALFGAGLNRPIEGYWAELVEQVNSWQLPTIAIDLASGVAGDGPRMGPAIRAQHTLCIELPKLAVFLAENAPFIGKWQRVKIDLDTVALANSTPLAILAEEAALAPLLHRRGAFDHKGTFGHAAIVAGSHGKMGACLLSARAALRSGAGLVTTHIPGCGYEIMQMAFPEAMCVVDEHQYLISSIGEIDRYQAIGIGPGMGQNILTVNALQDLLQRASQPMVIDADALNILAQKPELQALIPAGSILTPHPKEFDRLFGDFDSDFRRSQRLQQATRELNCIILLKGGYSLIAAPDQPLWINPTGNPGMGTAGAGDVLTGVLTGLLTQGYAPYDAVRLGVYLHGLAGDLAARAEEQEAVIASDIVKYLGKAFGTLRNG